MIHGPKRSTPTATRGQEMRAIPPGTEPLRRKFSPSAYLNRSCRELSDSSPSEPSREGWSSENSSQFANLALDKGPSDLGITREKGLATANKETPHAPFDRHGGQCYVHRSYVFYKMGNSRQVTKRRSVLTLIRRQLIDTPKFRSPPEAKREKVREQKECVDAHPSTTY